MEMERGGRIFGTGGRSEKLEVQTVIKGLNLPSLIGIGLMYLKNIRGGETNSPPFLPLAPPALN